MSQGSLDAPDQGEAVPHRQQHHLGAGVVPCCHVERMHRLCVLVCLHQRHHPSALALSVALDSLLGERRVQLRHHPFPEDVVDNEEPSHFEETSVEQRRQVVAVLLLVCIQEDEIKACALLPEARELLHRLPLHQPDLACHGQRRGREVIAGDLRHLGVAFQGQHFASLRKRRRHREGGVPCETPDFEDAIRGGERHQHRQHLPLHGARQHVRSSWKRRRCPLPHLGEVWGLRGGELFRVHCVQPRLFAEMVAGVHFSIAFLHRCGGTTFPFEGGVFCPDVLCHGHHCRGVQHLELGFFGI
mmetsp:Transcript_57422/g.136538  ORF Transcript_57422/g.136538 Transcript_57422/m.136538 type:complete len:301 (-) Transcript_57422:1638-2540(-)